MTIPGSTYELMNSLGMMVVSARGVYSWEKLSSSHKNTWNKWIIKNVSTNIIIWPERCPAQIFQIWGEEPGIFCFSPWECLLVQEFSLNKTPHQIHNPGAATLEPCNGWSQQEQWWNILHRQDFGAGQDQEAWRRQYWRGLWCLQGWEQTLWRK